MNLIFGQCDCCGNDNRVLRLCIAYGIDTAACNPCRGRTDDSDEADEIEAEIEHLTPKAETGEQWAHIGALEARMVELREVGAP